MSNADNLVFDIRDYRGRRVIFTKKKLEEKKADHPELNLMQFIATIQQAIREPEEVWPDYFERNKKHCYYGKYESVYAKVVVYVGMPHGGPFQVVSAYIIDKIKEKKYKDLVRIV